MIMIDDASSHHPQHHHHYKMQPFRFSGYSEVCTITTSTLTYWFLVSLIPVYNKHFFQYYPYPMATAGIQLGVVGVMLVLVNCFGHWMRKRRKDYAIGDQHYCQCMHHERHLHSNGQGSNHDRDREECTNSVTPLQYYIAKDSSKCVQIRDWETGDRSQHCKFSHHEKHLQSFIKNGEALNHDRQGFNSKADSVKQQQLMSSTAKPIQPSWIFGPHLLWKLHKIFPIGFLFGLKYGITNLGLHLVPAPIHLLLQSTDILWTMLGAWFINGERLSFVGWFCVLGTVVGSGILSIQVNESVSAPILAIGVNLLSPMLLGLCIATLRSACVVLMNKDNRVSGTVSSVEITAIKLLISSTVAIGLACIFETPNNNRLGYSENWWIFFKRLDRSVQWGVIGGSVPILAFQVNWTFLTELTSAVSVGMVAQLKIVPQWVTALLFAPNANFHLELWNGVGAIVSLISAAAFAIDNWVRYVKCRNGTNVEEELDDMHTCGTEGDELLLTTTLRLAAEEASMRNNVISLRLSSSPLVERAVANNTKNAMSYTPKGNDSEQLLTDETLGLLEGKCLNCITRPTGYHAIDVI